MTYVPCTICGLREGDYLADSDSWMFQDGMPVCLQCLRSGRCDPHEENIVKVFGQVS